MTPHATARLAFSRPNRQRGQALVYGIFLLLAGTAALFFMFNTGQLAAEKTKLVNTADAVALSAGVMHARALNFDAYTNRAMMANEVTIAQYVSLSSWAQYASAHAASAVAPMFCESVYTAVPVWLAMLKYGPLCLGLAYGSEEVISPAADGVSMYAEGAVIASDLAKINLELAQSTMALDFLPARKSVMQDVADANYLNDGAIHVDLLPLTDNFSLFEGKPFITLNTGNDRTRFREAELAAAQKDQFVQDRSWSDHTFAIPCIVGPNGHINRTGNTVLVGFDEWRADDRVNMRIESWHWSLFHSGCKTDASYTLGTGSQSAKNGGGSNSWPYSGVPKFYELSDKALAYTPNNPDEGKRDPRLKFAIRLTRDNTEAMTSTGRSGIKPTGRLDIYKGQEAKDVMAAVATSEVFFERPVARADGRTELASLFNPYWQVHLIANSTADVAAALALQAINP